MRKTTDRFNGPKFRPPKNPTFWAKINTACKVNNRDVLMLISGFKLYNKSKRIRGIPKESQEMSYLTLNEDAKN